MNGFENLFAMEVDGSGLGESNSLAVGPEENKGFHQKYKLLNKFKFEDIFSLGKSFLAEFAGGLPGIDEATSFSQMIK